jgi:hypothetical protein
MVKRDAPATSPSHYSFGSASSQRNGLKALWAHRLKSPCSNQPGPACRGTQTFLSVRQTGILACFFSAVGCRRFLVWCPEIRSDLALCDVSRSTNTGLLPALRRRCRSLRRVARLFAMERKTDEIHRLRHRPHRAVARGPRKAPAVLSMPYGQRRDTTAPRGWHIPIHARACA